MRAFRVDKLTYAALEATLLEYLAGRAASAIPVRAMLALPVETIEARARALGDRLAAGGWRVALMSGSSAVGGGSAPGLPLPTVLLAIERAGLTAAALEARLRALATPVVARIVDDRVVLDLRTVPERDIDGLARLLAW
jgi:L-seryl-tRNA(Ser) seleniumtransferase